MAEVDLRSLQQQGATSLARLFLPLYRAFNGLAQEKYALRGHAGLTTAHTLLFANLDEDGTRIATLAERMGTTKQFTGRLVHQLAERNYLTTEPDPTDRRATIVKISPPGLRFFADACEVKDEIEGMFKAAVGEAKLNELVKVMEALAGEFARYSKSGQANPLDENADG
jgi:DNA-binding MarR family transcriptional regulator